MISNQRLTQPIGSKLENDRFRNTLSADGVQGVSGLPSDSLLSGGNLIANGSALSKSNTFDQLLQLANLNADKGQKNASKPHESAHKESSKQEDQKLQNKNTKSQKKTSENERAGKTSNNSKDETKDNNETKSSELTQLLMYQGPKVSQVNNSQSDDTKNNDISRGTSRTDHISRIGATSDVSNLDSQKVSTSLDETLKKTDHMDLVDARTNREQENGRPRFGAKTEEALNGKADELRELANQFDSVQMDFSSPSQQTDLQSQLTSAQLQKPQMTKENILKMMQQDMIKGDAAFRDFLKMSTAQNALTESQTAEKSALMNQVKEASLEQVKLNEIRQDALLPQHQLREFQDGQPSQWKSLDELSPDQVAMLDALTGTSGNSNSEVLKGFSSSLPASVQSRITGQDGEQAKTIHPTQNSIDTQSMFAALSNDGGGNSAFKRDNSSFSGNSSRGEMSPINQTNLGKLDDVDFAGQEKTQQAKADARARESERTREMARTAAQRAQTIAAELASKGGGTARVQIKDSQLGVVELRINMSDNNRMNVQLVANSDRIKQELEKHADALKDGLEKHQLIVDGVNFATDVKLGESAFQNSTQNESQNQQQPQSQNQQSFGSFQQNASGQGQGSFDQDRFFESQQLAGLGNQIPQKQHRQNYTEKNEPQTNIQRSANGSLKVSA